jgi:hypothetical protein
MELDLLAFVYHCSDRIVIYGYLSGLSRPEQVVHFFRQVVGVPVVSKEVLSQRTADYEAWVEAFARNHRLPIEWAEKRVRKENHVVPWQRRMARKRAYGVYYIWPNGATALSFTAIGIILFAPRADQAYTAAIGFAVGKERHRRRWDCQNMRKSDAVHAERF